MDQRLAVTEVTVAVVPFRVLNGAVQPKALRARVPPVTLTVPVGPGWVGEKFAAPVNVRDDEMAMAEHFEVPVEAHGLVADA